MCTRICCKHWDCMGCLGHTSIGGHNAKIGKPGQKLFSKGGRDTHLVAGLATCTCHLYSYYGPCAPERASDVFPIVLLTFAPASIALQNLCLDVTSWPFPQMPLVGQTSEVFLGLFAEPGQRGDDNVSLPVDICGVAGLVGRFYHYMFSDFPGCFGTVITSLS
jgi:hypothetical protein